MSFGWTTSVDAAALPDARGAAGLLGPPDVHEDGMELDRDAAAPLEPRQ